ncbi:acyltransferase family protein [Latilactobacillus sakei]|jgi:peptidoglycan/LPS O-acetylase OafA/YrhL|uniref:O-acetyltransferase OatA n=1 Tax=Latilactobacillus sakei TaxID=1599 RepID=A0A9N7IYH4_LATSK|nr:acyltransferase family protein [Latilactobacillus sakei]AST83191.1 acyltransferase [Latilactobacillus sakei]AWZ43908.1 acyltransferase [Latilactobacillus sakei]AWZ45876.1 acyltransferase [Latilactobacillus sakei]AYG16329.1 acyltransferase [Latilactobacillus sakei]AYG25050.1 acyltransferase [Latilactobacillus sakei]
MGSIKKARIRWFSLIRIFGLGMVLYYHYFKTRYAGGFVGVDVFFTFSGYLITALFIDEFIRRDKVKLWAFYRRRFNRIFPPLLLMVLIAVPLSLIANPDLRTNLTKQITATLSFTTNFYEISTGGSYETNFIPHLFVHTWSLAVEMHFYLIWGLIVYLVSRTVKSAKYFRTAIFSVSFVLFAVSFLSMFTQIKGLSEYSPIYFSSLTHGYPFFVGAMIGSFCGVGQSAQGFNQLTSHLTWKTPLIGFVVSALLLFGLGTRMKFDQASTYAYGILLGSLITGCLIIFARLLHDKAPNVAEPRFITYLADISYAMYLFHWPLYIIFLSYFNNNIKAVVAALIGSVIFSTLSYYYIEPLLMGKPVAYQKAVGGPLLFAMVILGVVTANYAVDAPHMSSLEQHLWVGNLYQDADQIQAVHAKVSQPKQTVPVSQTNYNVPQGISIIGDSVTLGARSYLLEHVKNSDINAEGNRRMDQAYDVLMNQQNNNQLREYVVICIGTNAFPDFKEQIDKIVHDLKKGHRLIFMTPYDGHADATYDSTKIAVYERTLPAKYPFITVTDWNKIAASHPEVFEGTDGTHFGGIEKGNILYTKGINDAIKTAGKKTVKA